VKGRGYEQLLGPVQQEHDPIGFHHGIDHWLSLFFSGDGEADTGGVGEHMSHCGVVLFRHEGVE
jgi:hypothetical protein